MGDIVLDPEPVQPSDLEVRGEGSASGIEVYDGTIDFSGVANNQSARDDGIEIQEEIVLQAEEVHVEGLAGSQYEASGLFKTDSEPVADSEPLEDLDTVDLPLIMPDSEEPAADAVPDFPPAPDPVPYAAAPGRRTPFPPAGTPPAAVTLSDDDGAADTAALSRAEPVLTETMAELYLKQGHQEEALRVYQALQAQRPDDRRLRAKVAALAGEAPADGGGPAPSGQTVQAFLKGILASRPGAAAAGGERASGSSLAAAFAAAAPDSEARGEPTRAAADVLALDQVVGDAAPRTSAAPQRPAPAAPSASSSTAAPAPGAPGGFSFDEFFNAGGAAESKASPAAPSSAPQASGSRARPPVEEDGDLDQFQSWLKGLKS